MEGGEAAVRNYCMREESIFGKEDNFINENKASQIELTDSYRTFQTLKHAHSSQ